MLPAEVAVMEEQALAVIEAEHPVPCYCSIPWPCDVANLLAEVRRLQAEVDGLKQTQTVGTATMLGPWSTREAPRKAPRGGRRGPA